MVAGECCLCNYYVDSELDVDNGGTDTLFTDFTDKTIVGFHFSKCCNQAIITGNSDHLRSIGNCFFLLLPSRASARYKPFYRICHNLCSELFRHYSNYGIRCDPMLAVYLLHDAGLSKASINGQSVVNAAVFYVAISGLWAVTSYYIPRSDDFHLVCTLPIMVYLSAILLLLMPTLELSPLVKGVYEKCTICLYSTIILGTVSNYNPELYTWKRFLSPIDYNVTKLLSSPPQALQILVKRANPLQHSSIMTLGAPNSVLENSYFSDLQLQPWLMTNTESGFADSLAPELSQRIAERRAERSCKYGWLIEQKHYPMESFPWIKHAIVKYYKEIRVWENVDWRIRKFEKLTPANC